MSTERITNTVVLRETKKDKTKDMEIEEAHSGLLRVSGDIAERILKKFRETLGNYSNDTMLSSLYAEKERDLRNANPFIKVLLEHILQEEGLRLPRLRDLGIALKYFPRELGSFTIDIGFALRSQEETYPPNKTLTQDLVDQVKVIQGKLAFPYLISLRGTRLQSYPGSKYNGLSFRLTEGTEIISAPILNHPGYFSPEELDENTCLPRTIRKEKKRGDLELIAGQSGLCRAYINVYGDIDTQTKDLSVVDFSPVLAVKE